MTGKAPGMVLGALVGWRREQARCRGSGVGGWNLKAMRASGQGGQKGQGWRSLGDGTYLP